MRTVAGGQTFGGEGKVRVEVVIVPVGGPVEGSQQIIEDVKHLERPQPVCPVVPR